MSKVQRGILAPVPRLAKNLFFETVPGVDPTKSLHSLCDIVDGNDTVIGLGQSLILALGCEVTGLRTFPSFAGTGVEVPSTPTALWCWLRGDDRGEIMHRGRSIEQTIARGFQLDRTLETFQYDSGRDLTGYEDGTENPKGRAAVDAGVVSGRGPGLDGSSFVAVQQWVHDLDRFDAMTSKVQDNTIGRRKSDNKELERAPASAHVKRTAQESFKPEAFILRRSMPWADEHKAGLLFVAFGKSFDAFEALLRRMIGAEDGVTDALFKFTRPVSGSYFWCPPMKDKRLDLRVLGI